MEIDNISIFIKNLQFVKLLYNWKIQDMMFCKWNQSKMKRNCPCLSYHLTAISWLIHEIILILSCGFISRILLFHSITDRIIFTNLPLNVAIQSAHFMNQYLESNISLENKGQGHKVKASSTSACSAIEKTLMIMRKLRMLVAFK
jgi:hypothetical protein